jgi:predicted  nucleic acid-binding Zn-ribbon protein
LQGSNADDLLVVDCLLPGQIRKLGRQLTFLAPRRAIKTSGTDCEIRGGEYVAFDRADYATALRIWLPPAKGGDAEAQVYVGEIYEKGLGVRADYELAAAWYRKAAAQGNSRAQINLGFLYESGLGVERDITQAMNWYRRASGLTDGDLEFVSSVQMAERRAAGQELTALRGEVGRLRDELRRADERLASSRQSLVATQNRVASLRSELDADRRAQTAPAAASPPDPELQRRLGEAQTEQQRLRDQLAAQQIESERLRSSLNRSETALSTKREQLRQTETALADIRAQLAAVRSRPATVPMPGDNPEMVRRVQEQRRLLGAQRSEITRLTRQLATTETKNAELHEQLTRRDREVANIQNDLDAIVRDDSNLAATRRQLELSQDERRRLVDELAKVQLEASDMRQRLDQAQVTLQSRQKHFATLEFALTELRKRLAAQQAARAATSAADTAELRAAIERRGRELAAAQQEVAKLQRTVDQQRKDTATGLAAAQQAEQRLLDTLAERDAQVADLNAQLAAAATTRSELRSAQAKLSEAETQRHRLAQQLREQQLNAAELRQRLATIEQTAAASAAELVDAQEALRLMQSQLAARTGDLEVKTAQIEKLESQLQQQSALLEQQRQEVKQLESKHLSNRANLEVKLVNAQRRQAQLESATRERQTRIKELEQQLLFTQDNLLASERKAAKLAAVEQELRTENQKMAQLQKETDELRKALAGKEAALQGPKITAVVETQETGPVIEIIDPPLAATRAKPSVLLRSPARTVQLIGRVRPEEQLLSFKINQTPRTVTEHGLFSETLTLKRPNTPVNMVAVDRQGNRTTLDFLVVPPAGKGASSSQASAAQRTATAPRAKVDFGRYHALIIGNQNYANLPSLKTPVNDARQLERVLQERYGFKTKLVIDATRYELLSALNEMRSTLTERDNLLVFYAGHGELDNVNLRGHWLPVDAEPESSANWISNVAITDILNAMAAKHILVIADSCYSGAMTRSSLARLDTGLTPAAKTDWYRIMASARARAVLTSGGLQPVLDSGGGDHSIFSAALLRVLRANDQILEGYSLFRKVQEQVKQQAARLNVEQDPQYSPIKYAGHEAGEFFFLPRGAVANRPRSNASTVARLAAM